MALIVGYDRHPASQAALVFAGELASALNEPLHVVHVLDDADEGDPAAPARVAGSAVEGPADLGAEELTKETQRVRDALGAEGVQWTYHRLRGDPATVLLDLTEDLHTLILIIGQPEHGIGAALGHLITGNVARKVLRRSKRPVLIVPEFRRVAR